MGVFSKFMNSITKKTLKETIIKNNTKILDVGCGSGNFLYLLEKKHKRLKLYGIDLSENMLKLAKEKLSKNVKLKVCSARTLSKVYKKNYFDYVFITDAFHHFSDQQTVLKEAYNILKKEGKLIITDFSFGFIFNLIFHILEPGNTKMNNKWQFKILLESSGFKVLKQKRIGLFSILTEGVKR